MTCSEWSSGRGGVRTGKHAPDSGLLSRKPVMDKTLPTLILSPTGTTHFYCQSLLGLCSCGNKSFFQSFPFNLSRVCVGYLHKCIIFNLLGMF